MRMIGWTRKINSRLGTLNLNPKTHYKIDKKKQFKILLKKIKDSRAEEKK